MKDAFSKVYARFSCDRTQASSFAYETGFVRPRSAGAEDGPIPIGRRLTMRAPQHMISCEGGWLFFGKTSSPSW